MLLVASELRNQDSSGEEFDDSISTPRLGMWIAISALGMMFGALALLYCLRLPDRLNYIFIPPKTLYVSTGLMLLSSWVMVLAVRAVRENDHSSLKKWLRLTLSLGGMFVVTQMFSWMQLSADGVFARTNPFSALFYIMTGVHGVHLIGGIIWIAWLLRLAGTGAFSARRHVGVELGSMYWHFMDVTWLLFFGLLMYL